MAVIVDAKRTPIGKFLGVFSKIPAPELAAQCMEALLKNHGVKPSQISEVILGNVLSAGLGQNPARTAALQAHLPTTIPAFTVNKVCGSGMKAITLADQAIESGSAKLVLAGGMENMSRAPHIVHARDELRHGDVSLNDVKSRRKLKDTMLLDGLWDSLYQEHVGSLMQHVVAKHKILREEQDSFALRSHKLAANALSNEMIPLNLGNKQIVEDETPRPNANLATLSMLPAAFPGCTTITAGNACQLADGASVLLIANEQTALNLDLKPLARITGYASVAVDPKWFGTAPTRAMQLLEEKTGKGTKDYDLYEINEAFAAQTLAVMQDNKLDDNKVNVNGGSIALGHPLGASGARIVTSLLYALKQRNLKHGLATTAIGGGQAMALGIELL